MSIKIGDKVCASFGFRFCEKGEVVGLNETLFVGGEWLDHGANPKVDFIPLKDVDVVVKGIKDLNEYKGPKTYRNVYGSFWGVGSPEETPEQAGETIKELQEKIKELDKQNIHLDVALEHNVEKLFEAEENLKIANQGYAYILAENKVLTQFRDMYYKENLTLKETIKTIQESFGNFIDKRFSVM